jgi:hypothetical protein
MQTEETFRAKDGKIIQVIINSREGNQIGAIAVYGMCSEFLEANWYNFALKAPPKGIDVWRIRLYGWEKGTRLMTNTSWDKMLGDIDTVLKAMAKRYKTISYVGHSLGGTQGVYVQNSKLSSKVLWDPSCANMEPGYLEMEQKWMRKGPFIGNYYRIDEGCVHLAAKSIVQGFVKALDFAANQLPRRQPPTLVIRSTIHGHRSWPQDILPAEEFHVPHSDHNFTLDDGANQRALFSHTIKFILAHATK